ncbi:MAG TPA: DivIVA domain-containing protein [Acidimicrobiales bacterium]|nr:DivIVA domain-containing protein [Acidimicrobiales bacterium]
MDSTDSSTSALDAIDTVAFKIGVRGYNVDEVDDFLERLSGEVHQLKELVHQQRQQLRQAGERISQLDVRSSAESPLAPAPAPAPAAAPRHITVSGAEQVTAMIAMAQQFIEKAQQEAESKAREMTTGAQERAREIVSEARSRAEDEVNRLNGLKQRLSEDVETLTRQLDTERKRIGSALAEFSRWIESSLQVGGARTSASTPPEPAPRPIKPPPAPAPVSDQGGQVLNFEAPTLDDRQ